MPLTISCARRAGSSSKTVATFADNAPESTNAVISFNMAVAAFTRKKNAPVVCFLNPWIFTILRRVIYSDVCFLSAATSLALICDPMLPKRAVT